ncbi:MAG: hypothetical protein WC821_04405 [archaeon]|jgi:predicted sugar kinase
MNLIAKEFLPGTIFNPLIKKIKLKKPVNRVLIKVPARINAMVFDTKSLVNPNKTGVYTAGELIFSSKLYTTAIIKIIKDNKIIITKNTDRKSIVLHSALLIKKTLGFKEGLLITAKNNHKYLHCGFGSSAALQVAVAEGINSLYGNPIKKEEMMKLLAQNYGEEILNNDKKIIHVQSNGGGIAAALYGGGIIIMAGESVVIKRNNFPNGYSFVFGIPKSYKPFDAKEMMLKEKKIFKKMNQSSKAHAEKIAWNVLHQLMPAIEEKDFYKIGEVIEDYRYNSGSLENDGKMWPEMFKKMIELKKYRNEDLMPILSTSSCGPAIFSLTKKPKKVLEIFKKHDLNTFTLKTDNKGIIIKRT